VAGHPPQAVRRGPRRWEGCCSPRPPRPRSAPFIDPPGSMQRLARGVGTEVQILKLFPRFTMAKFKNRLTTKNGASRRHAGTARWLTEGDPSAAPCLSAPFIDPPGSMQRLARGVGTGVQILKLLPRITMANFKNRLTAKNSTSRRHTRAARGPHRLAYRGSHLCTAPALRLLPPYIYPPGSMQRLARGVGVEVQILKLLSRFTMGNFKHRLTDAKGPRHLPAGPRGATPPIQVPPTPRCVPGTSVRTRELSCPGPWCVPETLVRTRELAWVRSRELGAYPAARKPTRPDDIYSTKQISTTLVGLPILPNSDLHSRPPRPPHRGAYPTAVPAKVLVPRGKPARPDVPGAYPGRWCVPGSCQPLVRTRDLGAYPGAHLVRTREPGVPTLRTRECQLLVRTRELAYPGARRVPGSWKRRRGRRPNPDADYHWFL